jgi:hypothetical protein
MKQVGETLPSGKYVLNEGLEVSVVKTRTHTIIKMSDSLGLEITTTVKTSTGWDVRYIFEKNERLATLIKAPRR